MGCVADTSDKDELWRDCRVDDCRLWAHACEFRIILIHKVVRTEVVRMRAS